MAYPIKMRQKALEAISNLASSIMTDEALLIVKVTTAETMIANVTAAIRIFLPLLRIRFLIALLMMYIKILPKCLVDCAACAVLTVVI